MRTKGIGPNNLGVDKRNLASPAKVRMTDAEKAKMMAEKRAAGEDADSIRVAAKRSVTPDVLAKGDRINAKVLDEISDKAEKKAFNR